MVERRVIRVLTTYSKTFFFLDKGIQRGATYDFLRLFEEDLNKQLAAKKKKRSRSTSRCAWCSSRSPATSCCRRWPPARGTSPRPTSPSPRSAQQLVDFSAPVYPGVSEVVVSGPASPAVASVDDLAGKVVFVRPSSSYFREPDGAQPALCRREASRS